MKASSYPHYDRRQLLLFSCLLFFYSGDLFVWPQFILGRKIRVYLSVAYFAHHNHPGLLLALVLIAKSHVYACSRVYAYRCAVNMVTWISTVEAECVVMTVHATLTVSENQPDQLPKWLDLFTSLSIVSHFPFLAFY